MNNIEFAQSIIASGNLHIDDTVQSLQILRELDELYFGQDESYLSDVEYDMFRKTVQSIIPTNPYFIGVGSAVRTNKITLPYKMGSLDQVSVGEVKNWVKSKELSGEQMLVTDKMDGISVLLVYGDDGRLQIALTRGNGTEGQDITRHVKLIPDVPKQLQGKMAIRGEIEFSESKFVTIQSQITRKDGSTFKTARNAVSGLMNQKQVNELACKNLSLFVYELFDDNSYSSKSETLYMLTDLGFNVVGFDIIESDKLSDDLLAEHINIRKHKLDYAIDGIVVEANGYTARSRLISESLNPAYAAKYKILDVGNVVNAVVESVEWNLSKHGYAKPKIKLVPFTLQNVTISNTTGFNAKFIVDNKIGKGAVVEMTRSGDVIPYILRVVEGTSSDLPPNIEDYDWSENNVDLILKNTNTTEVKQKQLLAWATSMNVEMLKEGSVAKLFDAGFQTPTSIVKATEHQLVCFLGQNGRKIFQSLHSILRNIPFEVLMGSYPSFGVGIGKRKIEQLIRSTPCIISKFLNGTVTQADIVGNVGFDVKSAVKLMTGYPEFYEYICDIESFVTIQINSVTNSGGQFSNQNICFTGFRDKQLEQRVTSLGGTVTSTVSKNTTLLVALSLDASSSKIAKARSLNIKLESKYMFEQSIGD